METVAFIIGFALTALAAQRIGELFSAIKLPKISGYLLTGVIAGPFILGFISQSALTSLRFIDEISLAFIAFAAGNELYLPELRGRFRAIGWVTAGLVTITLGLGIIAVFLLTDFMPFAQEMPAAGRIAIALLAASIMVARSPSVAIAVINELRAKGPFTQIALGVTVVSDVAVILLFSISDSVASALLANVGLNVGLSLLVIGELILSVLLGYGLGRILEIILSAQAARKPVKIGLVLFAGYSIYLISHAVADYTHEMMAAELHLEPLLVCMVGGFFVNNYSKYRLEFSEILHDAGPIIYVAFFTLVGEGLKLDILTQVLPIAFALFLVRVIAIVAGSVAGSTIAGDEGGRRRLLWMVFITQAGVALGLAKQVSVTYPSWGNEFATLIIAMVVLNEMIGPITFKWAINRAGEAHTRATHEFDGQRDALIFGLEGQSLALARQLADHGWTVRIVSLTADYHTSMEENSSFEIVPVSAINLKTMHYLEAGRADAIIALLSDAQNYAVCELAYEHFGTEILVVRLNSRANFGRFHELGALIVDPSTAIVSLYDHLVRSPVATSLLLGFGDGRDVIDIELRDPALDNVPVRDLRLPFDTIILSIQRDGHTIVTHGHTRLKLGDHITVVGSAESLDSLTLRFEA